MDGVKEDTNAFKEMFLANSLNSTVNENWCKFKEALNTALKEHIPLRMIRSHRDVPWDRAQNVEEKAIV